ncbi:Protein of unknown function [Chitinophaga sp. YR573]|uniref:DUF3800 domain-containing protein n=1 Tax=Chitinophaga sp. YR573 TaxID=1881040 RepID=UPI0008CB24CE|nr:DUF3800 domain-containing protein [Chitinophaga sp. YR573]SEW27154.1 Protein of unknown function [Chitinophaga sp. YR573]
MEFEVYCDESGLEALSNKEAHKYTAIGSIWLPAEYRAEFKACLSEVKNKYNIKGELKWNKISPSYLPAYEEVINYFFEADYLRFRVILIESSKADALTFHNGDIELGFYKFYYQLLHHWLFDNNNYNIFIDLKVNRNKGRLKELKKLLHESNRTSTVVQVQALPSEQSSGIQLADILTGLVSAKFRQEITSEAKKKLVSIVEQNHLHKAIGATSKWEEKFNVFKIEMEGGW